MSEEATGQWKVVIEDNAIALHMKNGADILRFDRLPGRVLLVERVADARNTEVATLREQLARAIRQIETEAQTSVKLGSMYQQQLAQAQAALKEAKTEIETTFDCECDRSTGHTCAVCKVLTLLNQPDDSAPKSYVERETAKLRERLDEIGDAATWIICDPASMKLSEASQKFLQSIRKDGANIFNELRTRAEAAEREAKELREALSQIEGMGFETPNGTAYKMVGIARAVLHTKEPKR